MGFSQRCPPRTLADRVDDLDAVLEALDVTGPVVTAGHDWGGAVSLGWAVRHRDRLSAVVLANTAVHQPAGAARAVAHPAGPDSRAAARGVRGDAGVRAGHHRAVAACAAGGGPRRVRRAVRDGGPAAGRRGVRRGHPARAGSRQRRDPRRDRRGGPQARRRAGAAAVGAARPGVLRPLPARPACAAAARRRPALRAGVAPRAGGRAGGGHRRVGLDRRARPRPASRLRRRRLAGANVPTRGGERADSRASPEDGIGRRTRPVDRARGPRRRPLPRRRGSRRAVDLVGAARPAGARAGRRARRARGGPRRPGRAARPARRRPDRRRARLLAGRGVRRGGRPRAGCRRARAGAARRAPRARRRRPSRRSRWRPRWGSRAAGSPTGPVPPGLRRVLGSPVGLAALARRGRALLDGGAVLPVEAAPEDEAAVLFTSGATGPAKGVVYRHRQARAQLAALRAAYGITQDDRLVAAFPPFALYGPALGIPSAVPEVRKPGALTAAALARAVAAVDATIVFASPAALRTVVATAAGLDAGQRSALAGVRRVVSAGAPVPAALLHALRARAAARRGAHAVRDDRGAAGHRRRARRDRRRRAGQRGVRRASPARGRRRGDPADHRGGAHARARCHRRDQRRRPARQGPLRPAVGGPAAQRARGGPAPHRRRRAPRRRRAGCGWRAGWSTWSTRPRAR